MACRQNRRTRMGRHGLVGRHPLRTRPPPLPCAPHPPSTHLGARPRRLPALPPAPHPAYAGATSGSDRAGSRTPCMATCTAARGPCSAPTRHPGLPLPLPTLISRPHGRRLHGCRDYRSMDHLDAYEREGIDEEYEEEMGYEEAQVRSRGML